MWKARLRILPKHTVHKAPAVVVAVPEVVAEALEAVAEVTVFKAFAVLKSKKTWYNIYDSTKYGISCIAKQIERQDRKWQKRKKSERILHCRQRY